MTDDGWDAEADAVEIYQRAGVDPAEPEGPGALALALFGREAVAYVAPHRLVRDAAGGTLNGRWRIAVRRDLPPERETHAIAHEIAEWHLRRTCSERVERMADRLAAALVAPREALASVLRDVGEDYPAIARTFVTTQTSAAMRVAEVTGRPRVVVTRSWVFVRGRPWVWGASLEEVRALARSRARHPGLTRTRLRDRPERVVLAVDEVA